MTVTLDQIKALRELTGVSTMSCKKALEEAEGDEKLAIEILRKKGESKAAERTDRETKFGVVVIENGEGKAAILSLGCETDFVAKNEDFIKSAQGLAAKLLKEGENADFSSEISDLNIKMGEKIEIKDKKIVEGKNLGKYIHSNNKIAVLVSMNGGDEETSKDIAMHIAAMNPKVLSAKEISEDSVTKEKEIWAEQLKNEGKPENMIEKIMMGKEKKFREENALLTQPFVKDPSKTIESLLNGAQIDGFWRLEA